MSATLTNLSRQPVTVILDHAAFRNSESGWQRTTTAFANYNEEGQRQVSEVRRTFPASITLMPGQSVPDLHAAIANCTQVPALIARKILSVQLTEEKKE